MSDNKIAKEIFALHYFRETGKFLEDVFPPRDPDDEFLHRDEMIPLGEIPSIGSALLRENSDLKQELIGAILSQLFYISVVEQTISVDLSEQKDQLRTRLRSIA